MALSNILEKLKKEAQEQIDEIKKNSKIEISELRNTYVPKKESLKNRMLEQVQAGSDKRVEQEEFKARSEHASQLLEQKQQILDDMFVKAVKILGEESNGAQVKFLESLLKALPKKEQGEIRSTEKSFSLVEKAISGLQIPYKLSSEKVSGNGGFVFLSPEMEIDNRYETLVQLVKDDVDTEVAKILFP